MNGSARRPFRPIRIGAASVCGIGAIAVCALWWCVRHGERGTVRRHADAIVVLGAQVRRDGRPSAALRGRVLRAVALHDAGYAPWLVVTGGVGDAGIAEAAVMQALAVAHRVPESAVVLESGATRTVESAQAVGAIARARGWRSVIVVSDPFHLARSALLFAAAGLAVQTAGTDGRPYSARSRRYYRAREVAALAVQFAVGEIPVRTLAMQWRSVR